MACILLFFSWGYASAVFADSQPIFSKTEDSIYATLREAGYTHAGACGILGNIAVENPAFDADLEANNGTTYGLFQWNDVGNRRSNLVTWCNNRLLYPNRVEGQIAFALHEIQGGDSYASRLDEFLRTTKDPQLAAMEFAVGFERCIGSSLNPDDDAEYEGALYLERVGSIYQALLKRMNKAQTYADGYANADLNSMTALSISEKPTAGLVDEAEDTMAEKFEEKVGLTTVEQMSGGKLFGYRLLCTLVGYLFGNIFIMGFFRKNTGEDRRQNYSNYTAVDNLFTTAGSVRWGKVKWTGLVILSDMVKTWAACNIMLALTNGALGREQVIWVGLGVVLGNDYPFWNHFRGGMGVAVTFTTLATFIPIWTPIACSAGMVAAIIFGSLPLGIFLAAALIVPYVWLFLGWESALLVTILLVLLIYKLRKRLMSFADRRIINRRAKRGRAARRPVYQTAR